jgi:ring-1,2-phenylacetyl-CoA epoxidase subunit PaaD
MNREKIIEILSEVKDPELPVLSIAELGILREVELINEKIIVRITPTYSGCPAMDNIREDIYAELSKHGFRNVEVAQVLSPAWTTDWMTDSAKEKLYQYGIAPPAAHRCMHGDDKPLCCPLCQSGNIQLVSRFGSTACKALYRCLDCQEPFDYFKCH